MHAGVKRNDPPKNAVKLQLHAFEFPLRPFWNKQLPQSYRTLQILVLAATVTVNLVV